MPKTETSLPRHPVSHRQAARWKRERRLQRTTIITGIIAVLVILTIPVYGYLEKMVFPFNDVIVKVNDRVFTMTDYVRVLRLLQLGSVGTGQQLNLGVIPFEVLQILEDNEMIRQTAPRLSLEVTEQEIDQEARKRVLPADDKAKPDPAELEREFTARYRERLSLLKLSDGEYRDIVRADLLREKVRQMLGAEVPAVARQARLQMILTSSERFNQVQEELKKGTDFKVVSKQLSADPDLQEKEGDFGWTPAGVIPELDDAVFGLQAGNASQPIESKAGVYIVKVTERSGDRAHVLALKAADKDKAQEAQSQYRQSEDFAAVFAQFNTDPALKDKSGDLGWVERGYQEGAFDEVLFGLPIGKVSEPLGSVRGIYFIQVMERAEARRIDENRRDVLKTRALEKWLLQERKNNKVERFFNDRKYSWAIDQITKELRSGTRQGSQ